MARIYLDHAATSPLLPEARRVTEQWLDAGNASSLYQEGRRAKDAIDASREIVSDALGCRFAEVLFTSGGTEAANLAIIGTALGNEDRSRFRILMGASEHHCVLHTKPLLQRLGYRVELLDVDRYGSVDPDAVPSSPDILLVCAMHANNELGTYSDLAAIRERTAATGTLLHVDSVQTFRVRNWTVDDLGADLVTISGHKIGGPKGVGATYIRAGTSIKALVAGGGQEREVRGGTENVAAIAGFGAAVENVPAATQATARDRFEAILSEHSAIATAPIANRLPGHCHVRIPGLSSETALIRLDRAGISASSGSACSSGSVEPSHVLLAAGYSMDQAREGLRFTLGRTMTVTEAEQAARAVCVALELSAHGSSK